LKDKGPTVVDGPSVSNTNGANDNMTKNYKPLMYIRCIGHGKKLTIFIADSDSAIAIIKRFVCCICKFYFRDKHLCNSAKFGAITIFQT
jgi:hypothetical protein